MADLLKAERIGGGRERRIYRENEKLVVATTTDASKLVSQNKRQYNDAPERFGTHERLHKVADFTPDVVEAAYRASACKTWQEFMQVKSPEARKAWNLLLNSRDLRAFRTRPGRVEVKQR